MPKQRKIYAFLLKQKNEHKISLLLGARQVGKTTLLKTLFEELCKQQKNKGLFLDLDIFTNYEKVNSYENVLNLLKINGFQEKQKEIFYLFLDEFQRYGDLSIIMKNVYDNLPSVKVYASGSSSLKIKSLIQESLAGRKIINNVYPLDFEEFLWFKEDAGAMKQLNNVISIKGENLFSAVEKLNSLLSEFLIFGGYPEVVLKNKKEEKIAVLESIFDLYIKKDLVEYLNINKIMNVKKLIEYIAVNDGQKIKYEEICQMSSLDYNEVINYIEIIKETYLIAVIRPFFTNKNKELVKIPKIYFIDNGVRNYFINNFTGLHLRQDQGILFEAYCIAELLKSGINPEMIKFWQDKNKHEVDIIIDEKQKQTPIEVKYKKLLKNDDFLGLQSFLKEYPLKKAYLINLNSQIKKKGIMLRLPFELERCLL